MSAERFGKQRELDTLNLGERVILLDGVSMTPAVVVRICHDFTYSDYTAPLGYGVQREGYPTEDAEGHFSSRYNLFRESERDELIARLESLHLVIDCNLDELRQKATA